MTSDGADLSHWLSLWARWMRIRGIDLGYPHHGCAMEDCLSNYMAAEDDSENYWQKHRVPIVISVIDCCIDDLEPRYKNAIWYAYGIRNMAPDDVALVYGLAVDKLRTLVCNRIAIA
jgi:hypothetical protein